MADAVLENSSAARLDAWLARSTLARGAAAVQLIRDVLREPHVYVFAELLAAPGIAELRNSPDTLPWYRLLEIFSFGTYREYKDNADRLPTLGPRETTKLKHLSIVSLSKTSRILNYDVLLDLLDVGNIRELEDLIIEAIYQNVVKGKLDQKKKQFELEYAMGRDLYPGQMAKMVAALASWSANSEATLAMVDQKIAYVTNQAGRNKSEKEAYEKRIEELTAALTAKKKASSFQDGPSAVGGAAYQSPEYQEEAMRSRLQKRS